MALSRWSHSRWYIYVSGQNTLSICTDGKVTLDEINSKEKIEKYVNTFEASAYDKLELKLYLTYWSQICLGQISLEKGKVRINQLRHLGNMRFYTKFQLLPNHWDRGKIPPNQKVFYLKFRKGRTDPNSPRYSHIILASNKDYRKIGKYNKLNNSIEFRDHRGYKKTIFKYKLYDENYPLNEKEDYKIFLKEDGEFYIFNYNKYKPVSSHRKQYKNNILIKYLRILLLKFFI